MLDLTQNKYGIGGLPRFGKRPDEINLTGRSLAIGTSGIVMMGGVCMRVLMPKYEGWGKFIMDFGLGAFRSSCTVKNREYSWLTPALNGMTSATLGFVSSALSGLFGKHKQASAVLTASCMNMTMKALENKMQGRSSYKEILIAGASAGGASALTADIAQICGQTPTGIVVGGALAGATAPIIQGFVENIYTEDGQRKRNLLQDGVFGALSGGLNALPSAVPSDHSISPNVQTEKSSSQSEKKAQYERTKQEAAKEVQVLVDNGFQDKARWRRGDQDQAVEDYMNGVCVTFRRGGLVYSMQLSKPMSDPGEGAQADLIKSVQLNVRNLNPPKSEERSREPIETEENLPPISLHKKKNNIRARLRQARRDLKAVNISAERREIIEGKIARFEAKLNELKN